MTFTKTDYEDYCNDIEVINGIWKEVIEARGKVYKSTRAKIREVFKKHIGEYPNKCDFEDNGLSIIVMYNVSNFSNDSLPLSKELIDDLHMPVQVRINDSNRLIFELTPKVEVSV